uniref:Uncharacterized protein n=1 Tax=Zea mays TaxID=4577 RepID=A0A804NIQ0_MAIZE
MPCCQLMLDAIMSMNHTATSTPSWLRRLHAKKGISVPSNLQIDDFINGDGSQPSLCLPVPTSSYHHHKNLLDISKNQHQKATETEQCKPPNSQTQQSPRFEKPHMPQPQPKAMISNVLGTPSIDPMDTLPLKAFRKKKKSTSSTLCNKSINKEMQTTFMMSNVLDVPSCNSIETTPYNPICKQPKPNTNVTNALAIPSSTPMNTIQPRKGMKMNTKGKNRYEGKWNGNIYYTIVDTSIDKCKGTKKSICSNDFMVSSKNPKQTFEQHDSIIKGKRRFNLLSNLQEKYEKDKEVTLQKEKSTKVKNNHDTRDTTSAVIERPQSIDITTIDTSINGWKATKHLIHRGQVWEIVDRKSTIRPLHKKLSTMRKRKWLHTRNNAF